MNNIDNIPDDVLAEIRERSQEKGSCRIVQRGEQCWYFTKKFGQWQCTGYDADTTYDEPPSDLDEAQREERRKEMEAWEKKVLAKRGKQEPKKEKPLIGQKSNFAAACIVCSAQPNWTRINAYKDGFRLQCPNCSERFVERVTSIETLKKWNELFGAELSDTDPLPCKDCGETPEELTYIQSTGYFLKCKGCYNHTGDEATKPLAIRRWNREFGKLLTVIVDDNGPESFQPQPDHIVNGPYHGLLKCCNDEPSVNQRSDTSWEVACRWCGKQWNGATKEGAIGAWNMNVYATHASGGHAHRIYPGPNLQSSLDWFQFNDTQPPNSYVDTEQAEVFFNDLIESEHIRDKAIKNMIKESVDQVTRDILGKPSDDQS